MIALRWLLALPCLGLAWTAIASWVFLLGTHLWRYFPRPWWQWWLYALHAPPHPLIQRWLQTSAAVASLVTLLLLLRLVMLTLQAPARPLYGNSRWASRLEMRLKGLRFRRNPFPC